MRRLLRFLLARAGYELHRRPAHPYPADFTPAEISDIEAVKPYTMTTEARMVVLIRALRHLHACGVEGDVVECGVWKGGSVMLAARALLRLGRTERDLYLFDTFDGMTAPTEMDVDHRGAHPGAEMEQLVAATSAGLDEVRRNLATTGYPEERLHFVRGKVEDTLPDRAPRRIALLRLDTDWYESTRHELTHLYPRLAPGGVLIVDDYGHWDGARKAVDEFLASLSVPVFLHRIDYAGRIAVKAPASPAQLTADSRQPTAEAQQARLIDSRPAEG